MISFVLILAFAAVGIYSFNEVRNVGTRIEKYCAGHPEPMDKDAHCPCELAHLQFGAIVIGVWGLIVAFVDGMALYRWIDRPDKGLRCFLFILTYPLAISAMIIFLGLIGIAALVLSLPAAVFFMILKRKTVVPPEPERQSFTTISAIKPRR